MLGNTKPNKQETIFWPIIIGGCYRSGTSLLRRIIDSHSRIYCGPEVKFFNDFYGYYLHDPLDHARFFKTLRSLGVEDEKLLELFGAALMETHKIAALKQGKLRWANKTPENVLFLRQWSLILKGKFYFVHCVRNPLDTLASLNEVNFSLTVPEKFEDKIKLYENFTQAGIHFSKENPSISYQVKYEDFVKEPQEILSNLMKFLGEEFETGMLDYNAKKHQLGKEDLKVQSTTKIHQNSLGKGLSELTSDQIRMIQKYCSKLSSQLGYDLT